MSFQVMAWAIGVKLPAPKKMLLMVLANYADNNNECWPSHSRLADDSGLSVSTVKRYLKDLKATGFLDIKHRRKSERDSDTNIYRLITSVQGEPTPPVQSEPTPPVQSEPTLGSQGTHPRVTVNPNTINEPINEPKDLTCRTKPDNKDLELAAFIFEGVQRITSNRSKEPNWNTWANYLRLMRENDGFTHREIAIVFQWANQDSFWKTNILSPKKLREKFQTLYAKSQQQTGDSHAAARSGTSANDEYNRQLTDFEYARNNF